MLEHVQDHSPYRWRHLRCSVLAPVQAEPLELSKMQKGRRVGTHTAAMCTVRIMPAPPIWSLPPSIVLRPAYLYLHRRLLQRHHRARLHVHRAQLDLDQAELLILSGQQKGVPAVLQYQALIAIKLHPRVGVLLELPSPIDVLKCLELSPYLRRLRRRRYRLFH